MTKSDFVRRPGHNGKPGSHSRSPSPLSVEKKETEAGEFSPKDWPNKYKPEPEIVMKCTECHRTTNMYYSFYGERFEHQLECSICGAAQGPLEET